MRTFNPRDYQQSAVNSGIDWIKKSTDPACIMAPTGAGKALLCAMLATEYNRLAKDKKTLILVPSATLCRQNYQTYLDYAQKPASIYSASAGEKCNRHNVVIGTPGSVKNHVGKFNGFGFVIIDECFSGDTLIHTEKGDKRIDEIKAGDIVYNAIGRCSVRSVFSKHSNTIEVTLNDGRKIKCTKDHPFFTKNGYVEAEKLENGTRVFSREEMQALRYCFHSKNDGFRKRKYCCKSIGVSLAEARNMLSILRKEISKSDAQQGFFGEDEKHAKKDRTRSTYTRRKRKPAKHSPIGSMVCARGRMDNGMCHSYENAKGERLSNLLQNGHRKQKTKNSNRSGWNVSSTYFATRKRREKIGICKVAKMARVSSIESGRSETVFNLRVNGHPSYYANGVLVHNCHETTPSILHILGKLREKNPHLRVLGMTATPFRIGTGYIYRNHYLRGKVPQDQCNDESYYHSCIYEISPRMLIGRGYLTKPVFDHTEIEYDTSALVKNRTGLYNAESVEQCFVGKGRLTADIVADVVEKSKRRNRVLWFAATIQHAHEIAESLPKHNTRVVTGETPKKELEEILKRFEHGDIRHVINVAMLHRGFDNPVIDTIAVLRATESAVLYLQIIGRGLRLHESKNECLILDYAQNLETLAPHGDIFEPDIRSYRSIGGTGEIEVTCPLCSGTNVFSARKNDDGYILGDDGYFKDLAGAPIKNLAGIDVPSHYGRRCLSEVRIAGKHTQCEYRWSFKECPECKAENDIAAKYCHACRGELIDPHDRLVMEAAKMASDPYRLRVLPVDSINVRQWPGKEGKPDSLRIDFNIPESPWAISEWYQPEASNTWAFNRWRAFAQKAWPDNTPDSLDDALAVKSDIVTPSEVAFRRKAGSKFYEVKGVTWQ